MSASGLLLVYWSALATLSVCTLVLAQSAATGWVSTVILLVAVAKAWLITEGFMALRHAPKMWRRLMAGWALVLAVLMGLTLLPWR